MKKFLFDSVTRQTYALIWFSDRFFSFLAAIPMTLAVWARVSVARVGYFAMNNIDKTRCKAAEIENNTDPAELKVQSMELQLLDSSYKVRDHAQQSEWTDQHTEAIEAIGNALLLEVGWDEQSVEQHMKSVVESIDGLQFDSWFEDEE